VIFEKTFFKVKFGFKYLILTKIAVVEAEFRRLKRFPTLQNQEAVLIFEFQKRLCSSWYFKKKWIGAIQEGDYNLFWLNLVVYHLNF